MDRGTDERTDSPTDRDGQTDGQTGGQMDGQTDKSGFIGCCPTNVEHPIWMTIFKKFLMPVKLLLNFLT